MDSSPSNPIPLSGGRRGAAYELAFFALDEKQATRLRDLGLREGATLRVIQANGRLVVGVDACRIAIPGELASGVFVREAA